MGLVSHTHQQHRQSHWVAAQRRAALRILMNVTLFLYRNLQIKHSISDITELHEICADMSVTRKWEFCLCALKRVPVWVQSEV